ncbi:hypothetical protein FDI95_gp038 [Citrobacter phage CF1 ERZ-2017]|uniref:Uncharacterized protein n=1 Tax=Citrobacter phage CF1 ERZ-2017 TaxID=2267236 RepID=A0A2H4YFG8_9CAUD|nr:hypothetical protein FDI95_gp038 [Citrobacter phage CF1 ERZ-2017]AUE22911.1 hypothetical protein Cf1_00038 [Citrobacter phage CF1 ERZ-2017]
MHIFILILALTTGDSGGAAIDKVEIKSQDYAEASKMCDRAGESYRKDVKLFNVYPGYTCIYVGVK